MSYDLAAPLREALIAQAGITNLLGTWQGEPSIHTRRPTPEDAGYPLIVVSPDISAMNLDFLRSRIPVPRRDIAVYGNQPDDYRAVEQVGYLIRELFHRNRQAITVPGFHVIDIIASGPIVGPTDDATRLCRVIPLVLKLQQL